MRNRTLWLVLICSLTLHALTLVAYFSDINKLLHIVQDQRVYINGGCNGRYQGR